MCKFVCLAARRLSRNKASVRWLVFIGWGGKKKRKEIYFCCISERPSANLISEALTRLSLASGFVRPLLSAEQRLLWEEAIGRFAFFLGGSVPAYPPPPPPP